MCQGVFPSAFNSCDCPRSELFPSYPPPPKQQQTAHHPVLEGGHSDLMERVHHRSMYASSLLAKWVLSPSTPAQQAQQRPLPAKQHTQLQRDLHSNQPDHKRVEVEPTDSNPLDAPHLVHAFFFDST
ncbi:hypothetical protein L7F22_016971 [Adiantum nelumboides]|nr:hypothetical protein [Adiantum nelumboides]